MQANSIKITGGELRGRLIKVTHEQNGFRPAQSRVREAIFSSLHSEGRVESARVLDLFSGAGTLGIEALSRGAASAIFVEKHRQLASALRQNLSDLDLASKSSVVEADVTKVPLSDLLNKSSGSFDLIFIDPPYKLEDDEVEKIVLRYSSAEMLSPEGLIIIGRYKRSMLDPAKMGDIREKSRKVYGDSTISYYSPAN